jgi:hypothetical protein
MSEDKFAKMLIELPVVLKYNAYVIKTKQKNFPLQPHSQDIIGRWSLYGKV